MGRRVMPFVRIPYRLAVSAWPNSRSNDTAEVNELESGVGEDGLLAFPGDEARHDDPGEQE
jgi:hypothetical protein